MCRKRGVARARARLSLKRPHTISYTISRTTDTRTRCYTCKLRQAASSFSSFSLGISLSPLSATESGVLTRSDAEAARIVTNREQPPPGAFSCECMHTQARYSRFWMCVWVHTWERESTRAQRGFATAWEEVRSSFGLPQSFLRLFFLLPRLFPSRFNERWRVIHTGWFFSRFRVWCFFFELVEDFRELLSCLCMSMFERGYEERDKVCLNVWNCLVFARNCLWGFWLVLECLELFLFLIFLWIWKQILFVGNI